jgi:hypothetical protein
MFQKCENLYVKNSAGSIVSELSQPASDLLLSSGLAPLQTVFRFSFKMIFFCKKETYMKNGENHI